MSAQKSNMPTGTRQAALVALCLAACLFAWRGNILLRGDAPVSAQAAASAQSQTLHALLEPVLGRDAFRTASHTDEDGRRTVLILVDTPDKSFELSAGLRERIEMILVAATGFDAERDSLQIQPFAFARGTRGGLSQAGLLELGGLGLITLLLGYVVLASGERRMQPHQPAANDAVSAPVNLPSAPARTVHPERDTAHDTPGEIQRLVRDDPKRAARIIRNWMNDGGTQ